MMNLMITRGEHVFGHSGDEERDDQWVEHGERHVVFITCDTG